MKNIIMLRAIVIQGNIAAHSICNLKYSLSKEIPIVFHNRSNYDYRFIIKELGEEFEKPLNCLGEYTEKYITVFSSNSKRSYRNW